MDPVEVRLVPAAITSEGNQSISGLHLVLILLSVKPRLFIARGSIQQPGQLLTGAGEDDG